MTAQADRDRQAAVAEKLGYRSLCAQAEQTKNYLLDVKDRPRTPERQASIAHSASSQTLGDGEGPDGGAAPAPGRRAGRRSSRGVADVDVAGMRPGEAVPRLRRSISIEGSSTGLRVRTSDFPAPRLEPHGEGIR